MKQKRSMYAVMIHILVMTGWLIAGGNAIAQTEPPTATDAYEFPVLPGTPEWIALGSTKARIEALQIPKNILTTMSTTKLAQTCLKFPFLSDILAVSNYKDGIQSVTSYFGGLQELFRRRDAGHVLLERYQQMDPDQEYHVWTTDKENEHPYFTFLYIELLLQHDSVLNGMSGEEKKILLKEALRVFRAKQRSKQFQACSSATSALVMAKILEEEASMLLTKQIEQIPMQDVDDLRRSVLQTRPDLKQMKFTPIPLSGTERYQIFLESGGHHVFDDVLSVIENSAEEYLHAQEQD